MSLPESLPPLAADADQVQQVLVNLLMNAFDACEAGGHVVVRAEVVDGEPSPRYVRMVVDDDGCGIPPENLNRVLDPFFTTKKRGRGTGLGLSIVNNIVRSHGAEIALASEPGRGTQVRLVWPIATGGETRRAV